MLEPDAHPALARIAGAPLGAIGARGTYHTLRVLTGAQGPRMRDACQRVGASG